MSADETIAASHELMQSVVRFIKNNVSRLILHTRTAHAFHRSKPPPDDWLGPPVCICLINQNVSPESAEELKQFFSKAGPGKLSLSDERYIYRNLPLSMQIQARRQGHARPHGLPRSLSLSTTHSSSPPG